MTQRRCSIEGCDGSVKTREWCDMHYKRWWKHGDPLKTLRNRVNGPPVERFWAKVEQVDPDLCWEWMGAQTPLGYGRFRAFRRSVLAHRFAYELLVGPIPSGLELDHLCCNPSCVRPDHLDPVTHHENILRGRSPAAQHARKTHCKRGHEFTPENTYFRSNGNRRCRFCVLQQQRKGAA